MAQDKVKALYDTFVKEGYNMESEAEFRKNLANPSKRKAAYEALKNEGYEMEAFEAFEKNIGYGKALTTTATPTAAPGGQSHLQASSAGDGDSSSRTAGQVSTTAGSGASKAVWKPSERDKIRMAYETYFGKDSFDADGNKTHTPGTYDLSRQNREMAERTRRTAVGMTRKGRDVEKAGRMMAQSSGTQTTLMGLTPQRQGNNESTSGAGAEESAGGSALSRQGAVPYGVRVVNGERKTV